jgi:hypothetical protein
VVNVAQGKRRGDTPQIGGGLHNVNVLCGRRDGVGVVAGNHLDSEFAFHQVSATERTDRIELLRSLPALLNALLVKSVAASHQSPWILKWLKTNRAVIHLKFILFWREPTSFYFLFSFFPRKINQN